LQKNKWGVRSVCCKKCAQIKYKNENNATTKQKKLHRGNSCKKTLQQVDGGSYYDKCTTKRMKCVEIEAKSHKKKWRVESIYCKKCAPKNKNKKQCNEKATSTVAKKCNDQTKAVDEESCYEKTI
jgi:hypothetical protein